MMFDNKRDKYEACLIIGSTLILLIVFILFYELAPATKKVIDGGTLIFEINNKNVIYILTGRNVLNFVIVPVYQLFLMTKDFGLVLYGLIYMFSVYYTIVGILEVTVESLRSMMPFFIWIIRIHIIMILIIKYGTLASILILVSYILFEKTILDKFYRPVINGVFKNLFEETYELIDKE